MDICTHAAVTPAPTPVTAVQAYPQLNAAIPHVPGSITMQNSAGRLVCMVAAVQSRHSNCRQHYQFLLSASALFWKNASAWELAAETEEEKALLFSSWVLILDFNSSGLRFI